MFPLEAFQSRRRHLVRFVYLVRCVAEQYFRHGVRVDRFRKIVVRAALDGFDGRGDTRISRQQNNASVRKDAAQFGDQSQSAFAPDLQINDGEIRTVVRRLHRAGYIVDDGDRKPARLERARHDFREHFVVVDEQQASRIFRHVMATDSRVVVPVFGTTSAVSAPP